MDNKITTQKGLPTEDQLVIADMLKTFYDRPSELTNDQGQPCIAPHDGSLGLLALGHIGLIEWRKSKKKYFDEKLKNKEID